MTEHHQTQQSKKVESSSRRQITSTSHINVPNPGDIVQHARMDPKSFTSTGALRFQLTTKNRTVNKLLSAIGRFPSTTQQIPVQRLMVSEDELLQDEMIETLQWQEMSSEERPLQCIFEKKPEKSTCSPSLIQKIEDNCTGLPGNLKASVESLSGINMSDVKVHYNSLKPTEIGALAYTQGIDIYIAPGQEKYLPHEAWHVVQQKQSRVQATMKLKDMEVSTDAVLEQEANVMGGRVAAFVVRNLDRLGHNGLASSRTTLLKIIPQESIGKVVQLQVASGIANNGFLNQINFRQFLQTRQLKTYIWNTEPQIQIQHGGQYQLSWDNAILFTNGQTGKLIMHMHENSLDSDQLFGGGAWIEGGALGHDINIDDINSLKQTCVAWINHRYESHFHF